MLLAAAPLTVGDVGGVVGVESGGGTTKVPAEESDSPAAETPGLTAPAPTLALVVEVEFGVGGGTAEAAVDDEEMPLAAAAAPVAVG